MRTLDAARVELAAEQAAKLQAEERLCKADEESCRTLAKLTVTRAFNVRSIISKAVVAAVV